MIDAYHLESLVIADELVFPCLPAAYPSENSGVCWMMPLFPRRADRRGVRCDERTIVTVGVELKECA